MKHHEVLTTATSHLSTSTEAGLSGVSVTADREYRPPRPYVRITLRSSPIDENGANPRASLVYDQQGDATGWELHVYQRGEFEFEVMAGSNQELDQILHAVHAVFIPFAHDASLFDPSEDAYEWRVGAPRPTDNELYGPEDYAGVMVARCKFVTRFTVDGPTLQTINSQITPE